jgi:hypothetical protein
VGEGAGVRDPWPPPPQTLSAANGCISGRGFLIAAVGFGADEFFPLFPEPGKGALGAGGLHRGLVQGEGALGVLAAAVEKAPAGAPLYQGPLTIRFGTGEIALG